MTTHPSRTVAVELIVLHSDPRSAADALAYYAAAEAASLPHYYLDEAGNVMPLVPEACVTPHSGTAVWQGQRQNVDQRSVGITLAHIPGTRVRRTQYVALYLLVEQVRARHHLAEDAVMRWDAPVGPDAQNGALIPATLSPEAAPNPGEPRPDGDTPEYDGPLVLGDVPPQDLWAALVQEAFRQRGEGFRSGWAFHLAADGRGLGAPMARSASTAQYVADNGKQYGFQVFAGDTLFNEIPQWGNVQSLNDLLNGTIPTSGLERKLLEASFQAAGSALFDSYAFHQRAVRERLGVPLGSAYRITTDGQTVSLQVFAGDTLYTPIAAPEAATNWGDVRRLSELPPSALADALWVETYKPCGATYDANSPFGQQAAQAKLGAPLSGSHQITVGATRYDVQVFARDTLYAEAGGSPQWMSALPHNANDVAAPAAPAAPPVQPSNGTAGICGGSGIESAWLAQRPQAPDKVKNLLVQATCLLGHENTIFDALPEHLRKLTWGADPRNCNENSLNYKDICCADLVTLTLAAAGLQWQWSGPDGANHRMAHYYVPYAGNALMRTVSANEPYLPGDILTVSYNGGTRADHVMLYVGGLQGTLTANGKRYEAATCTMVEASINYSGGNPATYAYNLPSNALDWYRAHTKWMQRGRLLELEQAYREAGML